MSFTEDELQSFHDILEQRLAAQLRETERIIDERVDEFRHDIEQRILAVQQDTIRKLAQKVSEYQNVVDAVLNEKFRTHLRHSGIQIPSAPVYVSCLAGRQECAAQY